MSHSTHRCHPPSQASRRRWVRQVAETRWPSTSFNHFFKISSASISLILFLPLQHVKIVTLDACINLSPVLGWRAGRREGGVRCLPPRRRRFDPLLSVSEAFPCKLPLFQVRKPLISSSDCRRKIFRRRQRAFPLSSWNPNLSIIYIRRKKTFGALWELPVCWYWPPVCIKGVRFQ